MQIDAGAAAATLCVSSCIAALSVLAGGSASAGGGNLWTRPKKATQTPAAVRSVPTSMPEIVMPAPAPERQPQTQNKRLLPSTPNLIDMSRNAKRRRKTVPPAPGLGIGTEHIAAKRDAFGCDRSAIADVTHHQFTDIGRGSVKTARLAQGDSDHVWLFASNPGRETHKDIDREFCSLQYLHHVGVPNVVGKLALVHSPSPGIRQEAVFGAASCI